MFVRTNKPSVVQIHRAVMDCKSMHRRKSVLRWVRTNVRTNMDDVFVREQISPWKMTNPSKHY